MREKQREEEEEEEEEVTHVARAIESEPAANDTLCHGFICGVYPGHG